MKFIYFNCCVELHYKNIQFSNPFSSSTLSINLLMFNATKSTSDKDGVNRAGSTHPPEIITPPDKIHEMRFFKTLDIRQQRQ